MTRTRPSRKVRDLGGETPAEIVLEIIAEVLAAFKRG